VQQDFLLFRSEDLVVLNVEELINPQFQQSLGHRHESATTFLNCKLSAASQSGNFTPYSSEAEKTDVFLDFLFEEISNTVVNQH